MELILQTGLTHQQKAVDSIADVFKNTTISQPNQYYGNPEIFTDGILFENIKQVQKTLWSLVTASIFHKRKCFAKICLYCAILIKT